MNKYRQAVIICLLGLFSSGLALAEKPKIATVDMQKLFGEYHRTVVELIERFTEVEQAKLEANKTVMMQNLLDEVKKNVSELSEKIGYDYVFDRSGLNTNQVSFFLYLKDATDITEIVLKELNDSANSDDDE